MACMLTDCEELLLRSLAWMSRFKYLGGSGPRREQNKETDDDKRTENRGGGVTAWRRLQTKRKRRKYTGAKAVCRSCRNHGACPWCLGNRTIGTIRTRALADAAIVDWQQQQIVRRQEPDSRI